MKNKDRFTLRLSTRQLETLKETAKRERRTVAAVIRNLIDDLKTNKIRSASHEDGLQ